MAEAGRAWAPRLVATDLDGTLLRSDGSLSEATRAVLAALDARDVPVVLVTARPLRWMDDLWPVVGSHGVAVVSNGALTWDVAGARAIETRPLEREVLGALVGRLREAAPGAGLGVERTTGLVHDARYRPVDDDGGTAREVDDAELAAQPALKLLVQDETADPADLREAVARAVGDDAVPTWTLPGLVEISAAGVTKATGLAGVAARLGVDAADVVAFGDMPNDLPMLGWAGLGCAVANAHADVRAAADEVVGSNDDDGVARALVGLLDLPSALMRPC